jgi:hypothetical protein
LPSITPKKSGWLPPPPGINAVLMTKVYVLLAANAGMWGAVTTDDVPPSKTISFKAAAGVFKDSEAPLVMARS